MPRGNSKRDSNLELLRIVSMMMVLIVHMDGATLGLPDGSIWNMGSRDFWRLGVESSVIICVNCFTLISGYYGIKLRLKSVVSFLFQCVFYSALIAAAACLLKPSKFGLDYWLQSLMVLTHTDLWYVPSYFCLMLVSPLVNFGMEHISRKQNTLIVSVFVLYNIWAGWTWGGSFNPTGYTVMQLLMVYMIGRVIALYGRPSSNKTAIWLLIYVGSTAGVLLSSFVLPAEKAFAYNSPIVLLSSVAFFYIFLCMRLRSATVNYLAKSAFAVYLVHKAPVIWGGFLKPFMLSEWHTLSLGGYSLLMIAMTVGIYLGVVLPDMIRRKLSALLIDICRKWPVTNKQSVKGC